MAKETKEATTSTAVAVVPPANTSVQLYQLDSESAETKAMLAGFEQASLPPIVKPREMPIGALLVARIDGIMKSPIPTYKNRILELTTKSGIKCCMPITAVIGGALGKTDADQDKKIGYEIALQKTGTKKLKGKKNAHLFNVYLKAPDTTGAVAKKK